MAKCSQVCRTDRRSLYNSPWPRLDCSGPTRTRRCPSEKPRFQPSRHQVSAARTVLPSGHGSSLGSVLRVRTEGRKWTGEGAEHSALERLAEMSSAELGPQERRWDPKERCLYRRRSFNPGPGAALSEVCTPVQTPSGTEAPALGRWPGDGLVFCFFWFQTALLGVAWKQVFLPAHLASSLSSRRPEEGGAHTAVGKGPWSETQRHWSLLLPFLKQGSWGASSLSPQCA